jgi:cell division septation protein DedD
MRNNETGEFELIVGNRQLLSGFFIVVLLFAVAFAMGYVVGQNSPHSSKVAAEAAAGAPSSSGDMARPMPAASAAVQLPPAAPPAAEPPAEAPAQPITQPAREPDPAPVAAAPSGPAGSYWQVLAVVQPDAEVIMKTLKEKGFPVSLSPGPNNLVRVLVGPYTDTTSMGKAKTELENAGFRPFRK